MAATLATAGNLVLQGLTDHSFRAYRAGDGELLWSYGLQNAIITAPNRLRRRRRAVHCRDGGATAGAYRSAWRL